MNVGTVVPVLMFGSWSLNEIWIIDLSSALVGMLISSSILFIFLNSSNSDNIAKTAL